MDALALIQFPLVTLPSQLLNGRIHYKGIDEFHIDLTERLRARMVMEKIECSTGRMRLKPLGACFDVAFAGGKVLINVSLDWCALPKTQVTLWIAPCFGYWSAFFKRSANSSERDRIRQFAPIFHQLINSEFSDNEVVWKPVDDLTKGHV